MDRNPTIPPNFVTLRHLKKLKEKREEEERLRKLKEEEEEKEQARLRKLKEEEEEKLREQRGSVRSNHRSRGQWRGRNPRRGANLEAQVRRDRGSEVEPSNGGNREAQVARNLRSEVEPLNGANLEAPATRNRRSDFEPSSGPDLKAQVVLNRRSDVAPSTGVNREDQVVITGRSDLSPPKTSVESKKKGKRKNRKKVAKITEMPSDLNGSEETDGFGFSAPVTGSENVASEPVKISGGGGRSYSYRSVRVIGCDSGRVTDGIGAPSKEKEAKVSVHVNGSERIASKPRQAVKISSGGSQSHRPIMVNGCDSDGVADIENRVSDLKVGDRDPNLNMRGRGRGRRGGRGRGFGHRGSLWNSSRNGGSGDMVWVKKTSLNSFQRNL